MGRVMLLPVILVSFLGAAHCSCSVGSSDSKADANDPANFQAGCVKAMEEQVKIEFQASLQYILMAAHFDQDTVNLPNVANLFWTHADEERSHAIQFIQYLKMKKDVSARMKLMIDECSVAKSEDYHAADWLTGTWLEEQMEGQRHLAGLINTFNNFKRGHEY